MSLTVKRVQRLMRAGEPGRFLDSGTTGVRGLHLCVMNQNNASWGLRYQLAGKTRWMGLGSARTFTLDQARARAKEAREKLADRVDPLQARRAERLAQAARDAGTMTFKEAAKKFIEGRQAEWKSAKHGLEFSGTLERFVYPLIGSMDVAAIERPHVLRVLEQHVAASKGNPAGRFWDTRVVTADRVRNRIQLVLDFAVARGYRPPSVNPASWGQLKHAGLAQPAKAARVEHHAAVPHAQVPTVMAELRRHEGVSAMALQFCILCASRTAEVTGATWSEIDFDNALWTIPAARMKSGREHRVPLSPQALDLLRHVYREDGNDFVFIGTSKANLSAKAMLMLLQRIGQADMTVHGFRSSFSDWAHERTSFPGTAVEISLAHKTGDATEQAYRRTDLFNKRRKLMEAWGVYCTTAPKRAAGNVVTIRAASEVS